MNFGKKRDQPFIDSFAIGQKVHRDDQNNEELQDSMESHRTPGEELFHRWRGIGKRRITQKLIGGSTKRPMLRKPLKAFVPERRQLLQHGTALGDQGWNED